MRLGSVVTVVNKHLSKVFDELIPQSCELDEIVVSHQITKPGVIADRFTVPNHVTYTPCTGVGLSRNRNNAIKHAAADIVLICDDDVDLVDGFADRIKHAYEQQPDADVITFQTLAPDGRLRKRYGSRAKRHNIVSICSVSSIEITFKREAVANAGVSFDENFGLGSQHPLGEEVIFLSDCLKRGLRIFYYPAPVTIHPRESSGGRATWMDGQAIFVRMFGPLGVPLHAFSRTKLYAGKTFAGLFRLAAHRRATSLR